ncbi:PAQR family membrane homeostasis protein TrhA [Pelagibius marinus]|uniref:PAQR family membrane homeostasis protein TrhA n=1 Tax=Pelagibius marinus TaxID=2762760 RepID=UPI0018729235|nr:hemolysin III family protein [Pelagibius marinus]
MDQDYTAHPQYSRAEHIADAVIHVLGLTFGLAACVSLIIAAWPSHDPLLHLALALYGLGLLAMLGCSALYNLSGHGPWKVIFRRFDHAAIFVIIAGTYTPFMVVVLGDAWGFGLLAFVWGVALAGVALKLFWPNRIDRLSVAAYLLLGWSIVVAAGPLLGAISVPGLVLLIVGGVLYSLGVVFHLWHRLPYQNAIWHAFVLAAAACHFSAVLSEVAIAG